MTTKYASGGTTYVARGMRDHGMVTPASEIAIVSATAAATSVQLLGSGGSAMVASASRPTAAKGRKRRATLRSRESSFTASSIGLVAHLLEPATPALRAGGEAAARQKKVGRYLLASVRLAHAHLFLGRPSRTPRPGGGAIGSRGHAEDDRRRVSTAPDRGDARLQAHRGRTWPRGLRGRSPRVPLQPDRHRPRGPRVDAPRLGHGLCVRHDDSGGRPL